MHKFYPVRLELLVSSETWVCDLDIQHDMDICQDVKGIEKEGYNMN